MDIAPEKWAYIEGYPNYMVSSFGKILNWKTDRVLVPIIRWNHPCVCLYINGKATVRSIRKLVAMTFMGSDGVRVDIQHIDDDNMNNAVSNLRLVPRKERV